MIRLIARRLIIPRGDTGSLTIPTLGEVNNGDKAVLSIYDPLYQETKLNLQIDIESTVDALTFNFKHEDTADLEPSDRYQWDVRLYRTQDGVTTIDSYYAAFGKEMPKCVIKQVAGEYVQEQQSENP